MLLLHLLVFGQQAVVLLGHLLVFGLHGRVVGAHLGFGYAAGGMPGFEGGVAGRHLGVATQHPLLELHEGAVACFQHLKCRPLVVVPGLRHSQRGGVLGCHRRVGGGHAVVVGLHLVMAGHEQGMGQRGGSVGFIGLLPYLLVAHRQPIGQQQQQKQIKWESGHGAYA